MEKCLVQYPGSLLGGKSIGQSCRSDKKITVQRMYSGGRQPAHRAAIFNGGRQPQLGLGKTVA